MVDPDVRSHIVHHQRVEVELRGKDAWALQDAVGRVCREELSGALGAALDALTSGAEHLRVDRLELDLGTMRASRLAQELPARVKQALEEALRRAPTSEQRAGSVAAGPPTVDATEALSAEASDAELLLIFLDTGALPWWAGPLSGTALEARFAATLEHRAGDVIAWLCEPAGAERRARRVLGQFSPTLAWRALTAVAQEAGAGELLAAVRAAAPPEIAATTWERALTERLLPTAFASTRGNLLSRETVTEAARAAAVVLGAAPSPESTALDRNGSAHCAASEGSGASDQGSHESPSPMIGAESAAHLVSPEHSSRTRETSAAASTVAELPSPRVAVSPDESSPPKIAPTDVRPIPVALPFMDETPGGEPAAAEPPSLRAAASPRESAGPSVRPGAVEEPLLGAAREETGRAAVASSPAVERRADVAAVEAPTAISTCIANEVPVHRAVSTHEVGRASSSPPPDDATGAPMTPVVRRPARGEVPVRVSLAGAPARAIEPMLAHGLPVDNAGVVLLHPFLKTYFATVGLLAGKVFRDTTAQTRAVCLLQWLVHGDGAEDEHRMVLAKVLCGLAPDQLVPRSDGPTAAEREEGETLLEHVITTWTALKKTSVRGLREGFLQRDGLLRSTPSGWALQMEAKAWDVLLERLPWGISHVRLPWMTGLLQVER